MVEYLGRHVERGADDGLEDGAVAVVQVAREAEVADLEPAVADEYVGRFEVAVHGVLAVHVLEALDDVLQKGEGLGLLQLLLPLEVVAQIAALAELSHDVHVVAGLVDVQQPHDVLLLQLLHYLDLVVDVF